MVLRSHAFRYLRPFPSLLSIADGPINVLPPIHFSTLIPPFASKLCAFTSSQTKLFSIQAYPVIQQLSLHYVMDARTRNTPDHVWSPSILNYHHKIALLRRDRHHTDITPSKDGKLPSAQHITELHECHTAALKFSTVTLPRTEELLLKSVTLSKSPRAAETEAM